MIPSNVFATFVYLLETIKLKLYRWYLFYKKILVVFPAKYSGIVARLNIMIQFKDLANFINNVG